MPHHHFSSQPRMGRRAVMTALPATGLGLALLAGAGGCRWGPEDSDDTDDQGEVPKLKGDAEIVDQAAIAIAPNLMLVEGIAADQIGLAEAMDPLAKMHISHLALLNESDRGANLDDGLPRGAKAAVKRVLSQERELQRTLAKLAREAQSGDLARALASMSAGVNQGTNVLGTLEVGGKP